MAYKPKGSVVELNEEKRTFGGYLTVEIKDKQGDVLPIEKIKELRILDIMKERNAPITLGHRDYPFAKFLDFKYTTREIKGEEVPAVWFEGEVFNHYKTDDEAWRNLKEWKEKEIPIETSISWSKEESEIQCEGATCANVWSKFGIVSLAVLPPTEGAANTAATVEAVSSAKSTGDTSVKFSQLCPEGKAEPCGECQCNFLKTGNAEERKACRASVEEPKTGGNDMPDKTGKKGEMETDPETQATAETMAAEQEQPVEEKQTLPEDDPLARIEALLRKVLEAVSTKTTEEEKTPEEEAAEKAKMEEGEKPEETDEETSYEKALTPDAVKKLIDEGISSGIKSKLEELGIKQTAETPDQKAKGEKGIAKHPAEEQASTTILGTELAAMSDDELLSKIEGGDFL
ncbi:hypothetical protein KAR91_44485 [Candidatus Pacearchaeota archaeon]|nr:hypothetical protein [Candidatus Pacearchaeota archaeon]